MSVLTIKITQFENNIGHKPTIDFSYQIIDKMIKTKITEMDKSETFARVINLLYVFYPNKTFKISKPMRVEFFLDEGPIGGLNEGFIGGLTGSHIGGLNGGFLGGLNGGFLGHEKESRR